MHLVRPHRAGPRSCYCQRRSHGRGRGNSDCDFQPRRRQKRTESRLSEFGYRNPSMGRTFVQGWSSAQLTCPAGGARRAFRQQSDHGCCVSLYSADGGRYRSQTARIYCDRRFLVLWRRHGNLPRNYFAPARHASRSSLGSQSDCVQPARASERYRGDSLPGAGRDSHHGRNRVVPPPPLGMETSGHNHLDTGSSGCG
jgi:hypothetical protein